MWLILTMKFGFKGRGNVNPIFQYVYSNSLNQLVTSEVV
jgi:hypothetical protein